MVEQRDMNPGRLAQDLAELIANPRRLADAAAAAVLIGRPYAADRLATKLHHGDLYATSFHGGLSQGARKQALEEMEAEAKRVGGNAVIGVRMMSQSSKNAPNPREVVWNTACIRARCRGAA